MIKKSNEKSRDERGLEQEQARCQENAVFFRWMDIFLYLQQSFQLKEEPRRWIFFPIKAWKHTLNLIINANQKCNDTFSRAACAIRHRGSWKTRFLMNDQLLRGSPGQLSNSRACETPCTSHNSPASGRIWLKGRWLRHVINDCCSFPFVSLIYYSILLLRSGGWRSRSVAPKWRHHSPSPRNSVMLKHKT